MTGERTSAARAACYVPNLPATPAPSGPPVRLAGMPLESRGCKLARHAPTVDLEASIFDLEASIFNLEASIFDVEASTLELHGRKIEVFAISLEFLAKMALSSQAPELSRRVAPASIETGFPVAQNLALRPLQNAWPVTDLRMDTRELEHLLKFRGID